MLGSLQFTPKPRLRYIRSLNCWACGTDVEDKVAALTPHLAYLYWIEGRIRLLVRQAEELDLQVRKFTV